MARRQATKEQEKFFRKVVDDFSNEGESLISIAKIFGISYNTFADKYYGKIKIFNYDYEKALKASKYDSDNLRWANSEQRKEFFEIIETLSNIGFKKHYIAKRLYICDSVYKSYQLNDSKISRKLYLDALKLRDELMLNTEVVTLDSLMVEYLLLLKYDSKSLAKELGLTVEKLMEIRTKTGTAPLNVHNKLYMLYSSELKPRR